MALPSKILIVDNDQSVVRQIENLCQKHQIGCVGATTWENALYHFNQSRFEVCVVSLVLEDMAGPVLMQKWRNHELETKRDAVFVVTTGSAQLATDNAGIAELDPAIWMQKPIKEPQLLSLLAKAVAMKAQKEQMADVGEKLIKPLLKTGNHGEVVNILDTKISQMGALGLELAAQTYETVEEIQKAIDSYRTLSEKAPSNMRYVSEIGRLEMQRGNMVEAKQAFEKADKVAPHNIHRMEAMVQMYLHNKQPDAALEKCLEIVKQDPSEPDKKFDLMEALDSFGYESHAQKLCEQTTKPLELIRHFNNKGVLYSKEADYVSAIDEYKKAQKLIPKSKELYRILYNEALARINLKARPHLEQAEEILLKCLELNPGYEKAKEKLEVVRGRLKKAG